MCIAFRYHSLSKYKTAKIKFPQVGQGANLHAYGASSRLRQEQKTRFKFQTPLVDKVTFTFPPSKTCLFDKPCPISLK